MFLIRPTLLLLTAAALNAGGLHFVPQLGHAAAVRAVLETPDGAWRITASDDGSIHITECRTNRIASLIGAHAGAIRAVALNPAGTLLATAGDDRMIRVWQIPQGVIAWQRPIVAMLSPSLGWSSDGRWLAFGGDQILLLTTDGSTVASIPVSQPVTALAFSTSKAVMAVAGPGSGVDLLDLTDPQHPRAVRTSAHPSDTRQIIPGTKRAVFMGNGVAALWNPDSGVDEQSIPCNASAIAALREADKTLTIGEGATLRKYAIDGPAQRLWETRIQDQITSLFVRADGSLLVGGFSGAVFEVDGTGKAHPIAAPQDSRLIAAEFFGTNRLEAVSSGHAGITIGSFDALRPTVTIPAGFLAPEVSRPLNGGDWIAAMSPNEVLVIDRKTRQPVRTVTTGSIDPWPFTCDGGFVCAWASNKGGNNLVVADFHAPTGGDWEIPLGDTPAVVAAVRGETVAASMGGSEIRLWSLKTRRESETLLLRPYGQNLAAATDMVVQYLQSKKLFVARPGTVTALTLNDDGSRLAAGNGGEIVGCDLTRHPAAVCQRLVVDAAPTSMAIHGSVVTWADGLKRLRRWDSETGASAIEAGTLAGLARELALSKDGRLVAAVLETGVIELWDSAAKSLRGTLLQGAGDWLAVSPDGLFDASEGGWNRGVWRLDLPALTLFPIETYFAQFFHPDLVADILAGKPPTPTQTIPTPGPLPIVSIRNMARSPESFQLTPAGMDFIPGNIRLSVHASPAQNGLKVMDLRLLRNGLVVRRFPGEWQHDQEITLDLLPGPVEIRAYAFDEHGVKSEDAVISLPIDGYGYPTIQPVLRVLAIGINRYRDEKLNLRFARADAELVAQLLNKPDTELQSIIRGLNSLSVNASILARHQGELAPRHVEVTVLADESATRSHILDQITLLRQKSRPGDAVLIWFAGHGAAVGDNYVLLPHDSTSGDAPTSAQARAALLQSGITDLDLEAALEDLDASFTAIVIDACQSGKLLEGNRPRGPLNGSGFARLVYEKGIFLLAASQSFELALEDNQCGHGLLSCALLVEGLQRAKADFDPADGRIDLAEWLRYAALRVPELAHPGGNPGRGVITAKSAQGLARDVQVPRFVPRASLGSDKLIVAITNR